MLLTPAAMALLATTSSAFALPQGPIGGIGSSGVAYKYYSGNGSPQAGWPKQSEWLTFDKLWNNNLATIQKSCAQFKVPNNSKQETSQLRTAIINKAKAAGVDNRFVLAIVMQESKGCVRAPTTNYGVRNPGLMQDHDGTGTCNENGVKNPCPSAQINQMIKDGTAGTSKGEGLKQVIARAPGSGVQKFYGGARLYNSGSIADDGNLNHGIATKCYASDVANRLRGWTTAKSLCRESDGGHTKRSVEEELLVDEIEAVEE